MYKNNYCRLVAFFILIVVSPNAKAQCVSINNLPDTIIACKNSQVQLNAIVTSPGLLNILDTFWTPASSLTDPNIINPIASVGLSSVSYKLTVTALTPFNFVNNGNFSAGNTGFTTSYLLGTGGPWGLVSNEGTYAVTTNPNIVHSNFASFGDHTTGTGQMMVINGSATANVSVWCQTIAVQPNTTYDFSAWSASCVTSNPAILQFSINSSLLGTPFNVSPVTGVWGNFHATWFSGANTSATICITNQNTAASGNDFAIDDIEFREICNTSDSVYLRVINVAPAITYTLNLGCPEDTVHFQGINNGETPDQYIWDFGDGNGSTLQNPTHIYPIQGTYTVKLVTKKNGCADSAIVNINTVHILTVDFTISDDSICIGELITFTSTAGATLPITYDWDFGDGGTANILAPTHLYNAIGTYTVTHIVHDNVPCYDTISKTVTVFDVPYIGLSLNDSLICEGEAIHLQGAYTSGYNQLIWDLGDGNLIYDKTDLTYAYDSTGQFTISLTAKYPVCPDAVAIKTIDVSAIPRVNIGPDTSLCPMGEPVILTNSFYNPADKYAWNNGETGSSIAVRHPGIYAVTALTNAGCTAADSVEIFKDCYLDIPNAFTPDGDGVNDYFLPRQLLSKKVSRFKMQIFNRWGQIIFETNSINGRGWDGKFNGKEQPAGVYVYLIEATINNTWVEKYQGNVTLIR